MIQTPRALFVLGALFAHGCAANVEEEAPLSPEDALSMFEAEDGKADAPVDAFLGTIHVETGAEGHDDWGRGTIWLPDIEHGWNLLQFRPPPHMVFEVLYVEFQDGHGRPIHQGTLSYDADGEQANRTVGSRLYSEFDGGGTEYVKIFVFTALDVVESPTVYYEALLRD